MGVTPFKTEGTQAPESIRGKSEPLSRQSAATADTAHFRASGTCFQLFTGQDATGAGGSDKMKGWWRGLQVKPRG